MSNWRFRIVVVVLIGKLPLMGEVLCYTENSPLLIIDHIHAKINRVCCAALAIGKKGMNVRKNKLYQNTVHSLSRNVFHLRQTMRYKIYINAHLLEFWVLNNDRFPQLAVSYMNAI